MKKSAGFTLIELVIVIIILGILGAVAAPRLFNLQGDAYGANMSALRSSISSAATIANAKAQLSGAGMGDDEAADSDQVTGYKTGQLGPGRAAVKFVYGYPIAGDNDILNGDTPETEDNGILATLDGFEYGRYKLTVSNNKKELTITPTSAADASACVVTYTQADKVEDGEKSIVIPATVVAITDGC